VTLKANTIQQRDLIQKIILYWHVIFIKGKEALTDAYDKVQAGITPDSQKSAHQSAYDSIKGEADSHDKSVLQTMKEKLGL
jgi:hypothetical protein